MEEEIQKEQIKEEVKDEVPEEKAEELVLSEEQRMKLLLEQQMRYEVVPVLETQRVIENDVALNRDIMHVDSDANLSYVPLQDGDKTLFYPVLLPYIKILNDDLTKSYLKEEELAWGRMQLGHIQNAIAIAQDYGLFLPYINKEISTLHSFLVVTRSRNMAAPKLSKTLISFQESRTSPFLLPEGMQGDKKEGGVMATLNKLKPKKDPDYFKVSDSNRGINL